MSQVQCASCGGRVDLPADFAKAKIRCPHCGYYADVPPDLRSTAPAPPARPVGRVAEPRRTARPTAVPVPAKPAPRAKRSIDPRDHRPRFEPDVPAGVPLLEGTREFDDDRPYAVPGTGTKACPHCRGELPLDAALCVHCGRDLATGERAGRTFQPIRQTWGEGWPLPVRFQILGGAQVVNVLASLLALANVEKVGPLDLFWAVAFGVMHAGMQAFVLGTFDTLTVRRTERGAATLTRLRRVAFVPLPAQKVAWKGSHGVGVRACHGAGLAAWAVCIYLLLLACVPGVVFYWLVIHPERFEVVLCDVHGGTDDTVVRLKDRDEAVHAAGVIADATGLWHRKEM